MRDPNQKRRTLTRLDRLLNIGSIAKHILAAALIAGIALRVHSIWSQHLWGDELFDYSLSQGPWFELIKRAALDMAHPPLFYLILKPWIGIVGSSMAGLRLFTVALSIAALIALIKLGRELRLKTPAIVLASAMMAINNYLILYSYYLRSYSLLLFLSICSQIVFIKVLRREDLDNRRGWLPLTVINTLLVYTHYYGWLVVISQYLWIVITDRPRLRRMTMASMVVGLSFAPWIGVIAYFSTEVPYTFWDQARWPARPVLQTLAELSRCFNGGFASKELDLAGGFILLLLVAFCLMYPVFNRRSKEQAEPHEVSPLVFLAWMSLFPIVVSLLASYALGWAWQTRYVIVSIGPYLLLVAGCAFRFRSWHARTASVTLLISWCAWAAYTDDLALVLHGPDGPSYSLARELTNTESRREGPIKIYGLTPYAEQGLRLALNLTVEHRFKTVTYKLDTPLPHDYFWIALTENDQRAVDRVKELESDPRYLLGMPLYGGPIPQRHILIPVRAR